MVDGGIEGKLCAVSKKSRGHENIIEIWLTIKRIATICKVNMTDLQGSCIK